LAPEASVSTNFTTSAGDLRFSVGLLKTLAVPPINEGVPHLMARTLIIPSWAVKRFLGKRRECICAYKGWVVR
ncbi:MAG: hypothetical protein ACTHV7_03075, partial [Oleiphilaceae bacterium]